MMLLRFCSCVCLLLSLQVHGYTAEAKGEQKNPPQISSDEQDSKKQPASQGDEDKQQAELVAVEAHFLSANNGLSDAVEPIYVFQVSKGDVDNKLITDNTILCHNELDTQQELSVDRLYAIKLRKTEGESAVLWTLVAAHEIPEHEQGEGGKQNTQTKAHEQLEPQSITVQLLDSGVTWLLYCDRGASLQKGSAQLLLKQADMIIKTEVTAFDGRFLILSSAQLQHIPDSLLDQQTLILSQ